MVDFNLKNVHGEPVVVSLDPSKTYLDFYLEDGQPKLVQIDFGKFLKSIEDGTVNTSEVTFVNYMRYLERWTHDAPRKRFYRKARKEGLMVVLSGEYFFEEDGGEEIIDNLENTGKLAEQIIAAMKLGGKKWYERTGS